MPVESVYGKESVDIEARTISRDDGVVHAEGDVKIRWQGMMLCADKISYDEAVRRFGATGSVKFQDNNNNQISGDLVYYSLMQQNGEMENFNIDLAENALNISGKNARLEEGVLYAEQVSITSCPQKSLDWQVLAGVAEADAEIITAKNLRLEFGGVPVLYFPYFVVRHKKEKHSGFLTPSLDFQLGDGLVFDTPIYWYLADNYDATITPTWDGENGFLLQNEFRYINENNSGDFLVNWAPEDKRYYYDTTHYFEGDNWNLLVDTENVSDSNYFRDFDDSSEQLIKRNLPTQARLSYFHDGWKFVAEAVDYKNLDDSLSPPHNVALHLLANHHGGINDYRWAMTWEYTDFRAQNTDQIEGRRWLWEGEAGRDVYLSDVLISPAVGWRAVHYQSVTNNPSFVVPYFRTDVEKQISGLSELWDGSNGVLRFAYVYVPEVEQDDAPIFDTQELQLNTYSGFHHNRYVGGDRVGDASFLAYGVDMNRWRNRREELFVGLSHRYYLRRPRIVLSDEASLTEGFADFLLIWNYLHGDTWRFNGELDWNPQNNETKFNTTARAVLSGGRFLRFSLLSEEEKSVSAGAATPVGKHLSVGVFSRYLLDRKSFSDVAVAFLLRDSCDCWQFSLKAGKRLVEGRGVDFSLGLELSGFGGIGKNQYESIISDLEK